ncbi:unnamed protein product [Prorocentrum cordatum]|nr:unnamed protein product [Polarella glacialis]
MPAVPQILKTLQNMTKRMTSQETVGNKLVFYLATKVMMMEHWIPTGRGADVEEAGQPLKPYLNTQPFRVGQGPVSKALDAARRFFFGSTPLEVLSALQVPAETGFRMLHSSPLLAGVRQALGWQHSPENRGEGTSRPTGNQFTWAGWIDEVMNLAMGLRHVEVIFPLEPMETAAKCLEAVFAHRHLAWWRLNVRTMAAEGFYLSSTHSFKPAESIKEDFFLRVDFVGPGSLLDMPSGEASLTAQLRQVCPGWRKHWGKGLFATSAEERWGNPEAFLEAAEVSRAAPGKPAELCRGIRPPVERRRWLSAARTLARELPRAEERFARMGLPRGSLAAAAAAAVHGLLALGLWSSTPAPACPQPVCPAPFCPALVCPDCVSVAGAPDPGPPGGPAALGLGEVPEELAEIRSAALRLEEQLALVQAALEAAWNAWKYQLFSSSGLVVPEEELMREMKPGKRFALWYEDDTYWHERVALAEVRPGVWIITTPDGHRYSENIRCRRGTSGAVQAVHLVPDAELLEPMKGHFYRFRTAFDAADLVEQIKLAEGESYGITRRRRPSPEAIALWDGSEVEYQALMDSDGAQLVPLAGDDGEARPAVAPGAAALPLAAAAGPPPDVTWLIVDPLHPDFGRERHPAPDAEMAGDYAMALDVSRRPVPVKRVPIADVATFLDTVHMTVRKILDEEGAAVKADKGLEGRLSEALDGGTKTPPAGEDARTLSVSYDEHGERHKDWRSVCAEISFSHFSDWGKHHEGPATTLALFKNIQRQGGDPRLFYPIWCRDAGVSPQERTGIEMKLLLDILYLSGCYDQVNGPSLASIEAVSRRVCQIIEAHSAGTPGRANWEGVKHFMPLANSASAAPPELRSHAHRRAKEEVEIENMRMKARGLHPGAGAEGSQPVLPGAGAMLGAGADRGRVDAGGPDSVAGDSRVRRVAMLPLFPIPLSPAPAVPSGRGRQASGLRGHLRRLNADVNATVNALNWMAGDRHRPEYGPPRTSEQASVHARVRDRISSLLTSGVAIPSRRAAFLELLRGRAVCDAEPGGHNLASFSNVSSVSLPDSLVGAPSVQEVVGPEASQFSEQNYERMLRTSTDFLERQESLPSITPYWDPVLSRSRREFLRPVRALLRIGLVTLLPAGSAQEHVGMFFVKKGEKGGLVLEGSGICHYIYVDNLGVLSCDPSHTSSVLSDAAARFESVGLVTHEHEVSAASSKALGTHIDLEGLRVSLAPARLWKVRQGVLYALSCRKLSGRVWEVLLGHLTFCALINRSMMSVFRSIYAFINKYYATPMPLWDTARQEMLTAASLLFLMDASWTLPWSPGVVATDASEEGFGATVSEWGPQDVSEVGGILERGRFRKLPGVSARSRFFGSLEELGSEADEGEFDRPYDVDSSFPEVPHKLLSQAHWSTLLAGPWKYFDEGIFTLEARALVLGFQALASECQVRNARVLFLVDNMGVCLAFARGRTTDFRNLVTFTPAPATGRATRARRLASGDALVAKLEQAPKEKEQRTLDEWSDGEVTDKDDESDATSDTVKVQVRPARRVRVLAAPRVGRARQPVEAKRLQGLGLLPLESSAVQWKTETDYYDAVNAWRARARELGEPLGVAAEVDASVARQLQELFDQGENLSKGEKLVAGLEHFLPEFGRHGGLHLSRCYRALKGWRRRCPPRSRRPLAFSIWAAIIWELCRANFWNMGVYTLFMLVTYMRPSEPLKLLQGDLLAPAHGLSASWICFAFRQGRGAASKTCATDESIDLSCRWAPYLTTVVAALRAGDPKAKVFNFKYSSYTRQFKIACKKLGLTAVPYQARHSGASIDAAMKYRTRAEIKSRGRWKAGKSALRYDSKAKIVESVDKLSASLASHVHRCELQLGPLLCGQIDPSAIAPPVIPSSARRILKLIRYIHALGIPWAVENPATSLLWWVPGFIQFANDPKVRIAKLRNADAAAGQACQLCGVTPGTLVHRRVCEASLPPDGWPELPEACQHLLSVLPEARLTFLRTRGLLALRLPRPVPQEEAAVRWFTDPPDATRADLCWYTDGSMKFGPVWELRRTGCALVVVSENGDLVAYGCAAPPPWIRTAAAAELWAVMLVLTITLRPPTIRTDCRALLTAVAAGTAQATQPTRMLAQVWSRVSTLVDGDISELVSAGKLTWMPAHGNQTVIGTAMRSDEHVVTAIDWRANRLADVLAKAAAGGPPPCGPASALFAIAERFVAHEAAVLGAVTYAANHHERILCGPGGALKRVMVRVSAAVRRPRARPRAAAAPAPPAALAQPPALVGHELAGLRAAHAPAARPRAALGARGKERAAAARAASAGRAAADAAATQAICAARAAALRPSSAPPAAERLAALRARVLARVGDKGAHCSVAECNQVDFLPFTCRQCSQVFCLSHYRYADHMLPQRRRHGQQVGALIGGTSTRPPHRSYRARPWTGIGACNIMARLTM